MRYLTVLAHPSKSQGLHPLGKGLAEEPLIKREAIHHVELLADDTVLLFAEGSGDRERYEEIMEESPHVIDYLVTGEDRWMAVSQFETTDSARRALEVQRESDVVIEMPIRVNDDGSFRITYLGTDSDFQELFQTDADETGLNLEVVGMGKYDPDEATFERLLTERQLEVLEAAVELGYYKAPRQSPLEDVAQSVGISPSTASEHLRKVEEHVFSAIVR